MLIYHGSELIIEKPEFGKGKPYNDYGLGFYCTKEIELAKEWSCSEKHDGYANCYELNTSGLSILNLNDAQFSILNWLTVLLKNRYFRLSSPIAKAAREYLIDNFAVDTNPYDVIIGYRADDSYFSFAEDFLNNTISIKKLEKAMRLGHLGEQVVLMTEKAFKSLEFKEATKADRSKYYVLKMKRDRAARAEYFSERISDYNPDELYMIDIIRQGVKSNDLRIR